MDLELSDEQTWLAESVQTLLAREWSPAPDAPYGDEAARDRLWRALVDFGARREGKASTSASLPGPPTHRLVTLVELLLGCPR